MHAFAQPNCSAARSSSTSDRHAPTNRRRFAFHSAWTLIGSVVLLSGCASANDYRPGPPSTVATPNYSGPTVSPTRPMQRPTYPPPPPVQPIYEPVESPGTSLMSWFRSGRGWTWGAASRGPIRDEGLDRLMVDTLTNNRPVASQEPLPPVNGNVIPSETWVYPSDGPRQMGPGN